MVVSAIRSRVAQDRDPVQWQTDLQSRIIHAGFDSRHLLTLATIHNVRPVLSAYSAIHPHLDDSVLNHLKTAQTRTIGRNLKLVHVYHQIFEALSNEGIPVLPMKGNLFVAEYYGNQQFREMGDLDILIPPDYVVKSLEVLKSIEVVPDFGKGMHNHDTQVSWLNRQLRSKSQCEARFRSSGMVIDLHWDVSQPHYFQRLGYARLFENASHRDFFGKSVLLPHPDHIFWMLLTHHGGKESWLRLRHLIDLHMALRYYHGINPGTVDSTQPFDYDHVMDSGLMSRIGGWGLGTTFSDGVSILKGLELDGVRRDEVSLSDPHIQYLTRVWDETNRRSFPAIMLRNLIRYMRRDESISMSRYIYSYARNVFSNRVTR